MIRRVHTAFASRGVVTQINVLNSFRVTVRFSIRVSVWVIVRVKPLRDSFSVLLCAQHYAYSMLKVKAAPSF